jgi:hypothetical protein
MHSHTHGWKFKCVYVESSTLIDFPIYPFVHKWCLHELNTIKRCNLNNIKICNLKLEKHINTIYIFFKYLKDTYDILPFLYFKCLHPSSLSSYGIGMLLWTLMILTLSCSGFSTTPWIIESQLNHLILAIKTSYESNTLTLLPS